MKKIMSLLLSVIVILSCLLSCSLDISEDNSGFDKVSNNILDCPTEESEISDEKIVMPNSTSYYIGAEYTIDSLTEHFFNSVSQTL